MTESGSSVDATIKELFEFGDKAADKESIGIPEVSPDSNKEERDAAFSAMMKTLSLSSDLDEDDTGKCVEFFRVLYCQSYSDANGYRHSYSSILEAMIGDFNPDDTSPDYTVNSTTENLSNNIGLIEAVIEEDGDEALRAKFKKLSDHVSLEYKRLNYITRQNKLQYENSDGATKRLERDVRFFNASLEGATRRLENKIMEKENQIDRLQRDHIAILGIFAAVVIFANGGIVFSSSSIQAVAGQNIAYVAFIVSLVGGFIFNILYALFAFVYRIARNTSDNWAVISRDTFIKIDRAIVFLVGFFFVVSILIMFVEHQWAIAY